MSWIPHCNCKGPCEGYESLENYQKQVDAIREIWKVLQRESMKDFLNEDWFRQDMHFEEAKNQRENRGLENYQSRSTIVNQK
jgi:excinuclease ABC subunit C